MRIKILKVEKDMIILPNSFYKNQKNEKITTYQFLASVNCPVFDSVLFEEKEEITDSKIEQIKDILKSDYCTIRYQYTKPTTKPVRGGNCIKITLDELNKKIVDGTQMWLLQPIDRTQNIYGVNLYVKRDEKLFILECVGKGFDISDINRGDITPQESIIFEYPIRDGWQNEWWKFIKVEIVNQFEFENDKLIRLKKLDKMGVQATEEIFDHKFIPLDCALIEKLMQYTKSIDDHWKVSDEYIVSASMNNNGKFVFWDVQTPTGKKNILDNIKVDDSTISK